MVYLKHKHDIEQQGKSEGNAEENNTQSQDISEGGLLRKYKCLNCNKFTN